MYWVPSPCLVGRVRALDLYPGSLETAESGLRGGSKGCGSPKKFRLAWTWEECGQKSLPERWSRAWESPKGERIRLRGQDKRWIRETGGYQNSGPKGWDWILRGLESDGGI